MTITTILILAALAVLILSRGLNAYTANEQFASNTGKGSALRVFPKSIQPKTFAAGVAGTILAPLTPVAYNTSTNKWVIFTSGGSNGTGTILGFVWPDQVVLDGTGEVLGNVLMEGRLHYADIPVVVASYSQAQLKTALQAGMRANGYIIEGLDGFH